MRTKRMSKTKMMKHAKKMLCGLLTGCMLVGMMPGAAVAETEMPTTAETPESPAAPAALSAPTVPETPTTPASPAAIGSIALAADSEPAGQSDADGDEYGISLLGDTENESVSYIERKWVLYDKKVETATKNVTDYTIVRDSEGDVTWSAGWYVVDSNVTITGTVTYNGAVHLILCDGAELTVNGGIASKDDSSGNKLNIYGQTNNTGKLTVSNKTGAGIYAFGGLTIHGGVIDAAGNEDENEESCGIYTLMGKLTVNGGSVIGRGGDGTAGSYGINASSLYVYGGTIDGTHADTEGDSADIYGGTVYIYGGTFTADVVGNIWCPSSSVIYGEISGGTFEKKLSVHDGGDAADVTDLLGDGYAFRKAGDTTPLLWENVKDQTTIENVTVVPCPHSMKEDGTCYYCGESFEARNETTRAVYISIYDALCNAAEDETVTMLADAKGDKGNFVYSESKRILLDLNGKTLGILRVDGEPLVIVTDSKGGGVIGKVDTNTLSNESLTVSDLLQSGYAFKSTDGTWYDATHDASAKIVENVSVKPQPITGMTITPTSGSCTYGYAAADAPTFTAAVDQTQGVTESVTYAWYVKEKSAGDFTLQADAIEAGFQFPAGQNAGTYDVKCVADCDGYKLEQTVTVTVDKADAVCTDTPAAKQDLSYNGSPQALITAGATDDGMMQYQLDGGEWSTTIPTADKTGTYHIRYRVVGDANHNDSAEAELTVTIAKAAPTVSTDLTASVTYGDAVKAAAIKGAMCNASGSNVAGSFVWENVTTYGDATGENETHTLYATFIPADTVNYDCASRIPVAVTVAKAGYTGTTAADGSAKYGASNTVDLSGLVMSGGKAVIDTVTDTSDVLDGTPTIDGTTLAFVFNENAVPDQTATVTVNVSDCKNYENYTITVTLTVNDKNVPTVTAPSAKTLTYNGADQVLIEAAKTTGGTLQYSLDNHTWSAELPKAKTAGKYTVYYKVNGNDDYADVPAASVTVTIGRKAVTVKPKSYSITQGNAIPTFAPEFDGLVNGDSLNMTGTPAFTCTEADGTTTVSTQTAAGTYTITWTNPAELDFTNETNYAVTKETTGTLTISAKSGSSGGGGGYSGGAAPAPSEKPTDKPDQEPSNKPTLDRNELLQTANRLTYQVMYRLPLPVFPRAVWKLLLKIDFFK